MMSVSGTPLAPWAQSVNPGENARRFVDRINCYGPNSLSVLSCLQSKRPQEIISALEEHLARGNVSNIFAPVVDTFLDRSDQFIGDSLENLRRGSVDRRITFMIGENEEDGSELMFYLRRNFERLNTRELKYFVENTLLPISLQKYGQLISSPFIQQLLSFQYFPSLVSSETLLDKDFLLKSIQTFLTDCYYAAPIRETLDTLAESGTTVFSFVNKHSILQPYSSYNNRPAPGAGTVIAMLMGTRQFEIQTGSGMRGLDRQVSVNVQDALVPFFERGQPQKDLQWPRYTLQNKHYLEVDDVRTFKEYKVKNTTFWLSLLPSLASISSSSQITTPTPELGERGPGNDVYSTMTWLLLATVLLLLVLLAVSWVIARRRYKTESMFTLGSGIGGSSCIESRGPRPSSGTGGRWRETLTSHRM